jgi:ribosome-associated protein
MKNQALKFLDLVAQSIFDKKGFNILALDVRKVSTMADYFIIAEGSVDRHVKALAQEIVARAKETGTRPLHVEGLQDGDWVVVDFGDVVIHLFTPELREKYSIEEVWREGKIVDVSIEIKETKI